LKVVSDQGDAGRLHGDVRARAYGDSDIRPGQRGSIVDPVADHGHPPPFGLEPPDLFDLIGRKKFGDDFIDPCFRLSPQRYVCYRRSA